MVFTFGRADVCSSRGRANSALGRAYLSWFGPASLGERGAKSASEIQHGMVAAVRMKESHGLDLIG